MAVVVNSDLFPKVVENRVGERLTVHSVAEQDAATAKGYLRSIARKREFAEQQQVEKEA